MLSPSEIRRGIEHWNQKSVYMISDRAKGAIRGAMAKAFKSVGITDKNDLSEARHLVTGYLVIPESQTLRPMSSNDLTPGQWVGFSRWQSERLPNGSFCQRRTFVDEVIMILYRAKHDLKVANGQLPLGGLLMIWEAKDSAYENWYDVDYLKTM